MGLVDMSLRLLACLIVIQSASGTHFRYGTISWIISQSTRDYYSQLPVDVTICNKFTVEFDMKLAFRRDYTWGAFFNESWRVNENDNWKTMTGQSVVCGAAGITCFHETVSEADHRRYQIKFPSGQGTNGVALVPFANPRICASPLHKGVFGNYTWDPAQDGCSEMGGYQHSDTNAIELRCQASGLEYDPPYRVSRAPRDPENPNPMNDETMVCTPWHELVTTVMGMVMAPSLRSRI
uniref:Uncharacterized protein n=1 Tax=Tetraselmis sp. GSL018 TaxID=582737 RepID=A0A061RH69_9CHLO